MATAEVEPAPALPDYLTNPNAVLGDTAEWRYGRAPDYSNTRKVYENTKKHNHEAASLPSLVENLVKNWEIEASFKSKLEDWRTVDHPNYTFSINGGPPQTAEHILKVGTYNAIIAPNEFYSPKTSDFSKSHKTFKRMMPTFAWEVIEVYSGPPQVAFRWRHWGEMKNNYVGFNDKGEKITAKAHGGSIDVEGVTVATVDDKVRLQKVETWFDPLEMFRQIAPNGIVNKEIVPLEKTAEVEKTTASEETAASGKTAAHVENAVPNEEAVALDKIAAPEEITEVKKTAASEEVVALGKTHAPEETAELEETTAPEKPELWKAVVLEETEAEKTTTSKKTMNVENHEETSNAEEATNVKVPLDSTVNRGIDDLEPKIELAAPEAGEAPGNAVVAAPNSEETKMVHEEMSRISASECPFLMNRE